nr:reverse transcriptase domain-containing protein [Tanacetum cinerariifolium]
MDHDLGTYGMATDYCIMKEGMSILRGRKSVPAISSSERENGKKSLLYHEEMSILSGRKSVPGIVAIVQLIIFIADSGCTKYMAGNLTLLCNFVEKYMGTIRFGNDQFALILGYEDLVQGNITISRVHYVEGLNHNLFLVGQFCDANLEVAFQKSTCFVRDLQRNDLLTGMVMRFDETFSAAWDRFKDLLRKCPHYGFSKLHQIDTFYNALTQSDQDFLNTTAGGNILNRTPQDALRIIKNKSKANQQASVKAIEETCVTCGRPHPYYECLATGGNTFDACTSVGTYNQKGNGYRPQGPSIPPTSSSLPKEVERESELTRDKVQTTNLGSTAHVQPLVFQFPIPKPNVSPKPNPKPSIPYPLRLNDQKLREKTNSQMLKFLQIFRRLQFDLSFTKDLLHIPNDPPKKLSKKLRDPGRFLIPCDFLGLDSCMALADLGASINLMPLSIWKNLSLPDLTHTRITLELATRSIAYPAGIAEDIFVQAGKFTFLADFFFVGYDVNPRVPFILWRPFLRMAHALVDVHGEELILRDSDEKMIFHADSTSKHPHKHGNDTTPLFDSFPSLTHFETNDSLLEEFANELALFDPFPSGNMDFDLEADLRKIKYLPNQDL